MGPGRGAGSVGRSRRTWPDRPGHAPYPPQSRKVRRVGLRCVVLGARIVVCREPITRRSAGVFAPRGSCGTATRTAGTAFPSEQEGVKLAHGGRPRTRHVSSAAPNAQQPQSAKRPRIVKQIGLVVALGLGALLMSGCDAHDAMRFGWPEGVTSEAKDMEHLWTWSVIAALVMGIIVWALIFWTITFHRHKDGEDEFPKQFGYNVPLELAYTAIPFVIIAVLFYFTVVVQNDVEKKQDNPTVVVDVTAFQWNWKFGYQQVTLASGEKLDLLERKGNPDEIEKGSAGGDNKTPFDVQVPEKLEHDGHETDEDKPGPAGGRDDDVRNYLNFDTIETVGSSTEIPVLVLPVGERIEFDVKSADVVHSFWVPQFLFKRDVMPFPKQNHSDSRFQVSKIEREGAFVGRCAEMCGTFHSMMNFEVRAVQRDVFDRYIQARQSNPEWTNGQALEYVCQQPESVTTVPFETRRKTGGDTPKDLGDADNTTLANCTIGANR
ncbi:MAG: cytochrome c oxidase subunit II [Gordonia sp.]|nr:cytochrome c oxidase subunit II [Gordonia sp. (in: high G+C Gram-positive bacteria)]